MMLIVIQIVMSNKNAYYDPYDVILGSIIFSLPVSIVSALVFSGYTGSILEALVLAIFVILCVSVSRQYFVPSEPKPV